MSDDLLVAVRHNKLIEIIEEQGSVNVRNLGKLFNVSVATIRRDLAVLQAKGLLARTHGGAVAISPVTYDLPNEERATTNVVEKRRIGLAAIDLLNGDETVFLDAGTTSLMIAQAARRKPDCIYITSALGVATVLKELHIRSFYLVGGAYIDVNDSFGGSMTISAIRALAFDIAFLCVTSIDVIRKTISLGSESYCQIQKEAIAVSRKTFVVADHTKFKSTAFAVSATFEQLDGVITTDKVGNELRKKCQEANLELVFA